jgi:hypothetical protein
LRIAKALASIRPSFISCNKNLGHEDLIFMEKCFQRTLCEYEDFVNHYGTPTIICRRTGEIASVSKEFSLVTGWRRDVLLGKEPNLSVNTGSNGSGTHTGTSSRGAVTPRATNVDIDPGRPQPVFLAELMDEDSVVQFYEDFAELAFGASRASIIGRAVSLLKYKTKEDVGWSAADFNDDGKRQNRLSSGESNMDFMKGEAGTKALGDRDGRVECSMCWTIKRDTFDIPVSIELYASDESNTNILADAYCDEREFSPLPLQNCHVLYTDCFLVPTYHLNNEFDENTEWAAFCIIVFWACILRHRLARFMLVAGSRIRVFLPGDGRLELTPSMTFSYALTLFTIAMNRSRCAWSCLCFPLLISQSLPLVALLW